MSRARDLADGTFSGEFAADSPTLVVDSTNNRVGIGTSSPSVELEVVDTTGTSLIRASGDAGGTTVTAQMAGSISGYGVFGTLTNHDTVFFANNAEKVRIDTSGRVTKPYQPTGFWYLTGTQTIPSGSTEVVELNATGYSQGLSLNTSTRTITVPVAGKYLVCGAVTFLYGEAVHCGIQVNGGVSASAGVPNEWLQNGDYGTQSGDQESMQNVRILNLSANDTIRMRAYQQSGSTQQLQNGGRTFLSVTLLG